MILRFLRMPSMTLNFSLGLHLAWFCWEGAHSFSDLIFPGREDPSSHGSTAFMEGKEGRKREGGKEGSQPVVGRPSSDTYSVLIQEEVE